MQSTVRFWANECPRSTKSTGQLGGGKKGLNTWPSHPGWSFILLL